MSVNAIGNHPGWAPTPGESNWQNVLDASADVLGLSPSAVSQQLRAGGTSLSSIAQQQGVSAQALTQAIAGALSPSTLASTTSEQQSQVAQRIAQRTGGGQARYSGGGVADELAEFDDAQVSASAGPAPQLANAATTYAASGATNAPVQSGAAIDERA
ncbi:MAG: hypothetical protein ABSC56_06690 [Solirubrobacteraceae bacterium]|jgi:hypothetical protein